MDNAKILVAVDFGPTSARAFATALDLAGRLGASLDIVHVTAPVPIEASAAGVMSPVVEQAHDELETLRRLAAQRGILSRAHLRQETIVFGLVQAIGELDPQMVVVGSHGYRGVKRALLGSVSESLARRSSVPVLIVPAPERTPAATRAAWSCVDCGHILANGETPERCTRCGRLAPRWASAPILDQPADIDEPAIGAAVAEDLTPVQTSEGGGGGGFFATAPAGGNDRTVPNAELRVRY
jgi:universal stress protein A